MKFFKNVEKNKGAALSDVVIAILIMILFLGILTSGYYNIYKNNISIKREAIATDYAIMILEDIDKMSYEDVTEKLNLDLDNKYNILDDYTVYLNIENYNENDSSKQDIIKIVTLNIQYKDVDDDINYTVQKLKIKEL